MRTRTWVVLLVSVAVAAPGSLVGYRLLADRDLPLLPNRCGPSHAAVEDGSAGLPPGTPPASWVLPQGDGDGEAATPWSVAFAPDGRSVAVGGGAGRTLVWDLTTGRSTCTLVSQGTHWTWEYGRTDTQVQTVAIPSPGTVLTRDLRTRLWSTRTGRVRSVPRLPEDAVVSEDGRRAATVQDGQDGQVTVVDVAGGDRVASWPAREDTSVGAVSRDGSLVATTVDIPAGSGAAPVELHRVPGGDLVRTLPMPAGTTALLALKVSADGSRVAARTTGQGLELVVWDAGTGTVVTTIRQDDEPEALSPDGTLVVLSGQDATTVVEVATGRIRLRLPPSRGIGFAQAAFSPDGRSLAVILDHAVGVWPVPS